MSATRVIGFTLLAAVVAGCSGSGSGVRILDDSSKSVAEPIRNLAASEIESALAGKTFQYTRADGNGFVTYQSGGTFEFQDDVKGSGTGTWSVKEGQFCEAFGAGAATECGEFKTTGDAYFAAKSRLVEMKT